MKITIKGKPKEIAALVVGLQERRDVGQIHSNRDEGDRESMIKALEGRLARLKSSPFGADDRISLLERKVDLLAAVHTCKNGIPRKEWDALFTQTDVTDQALSECQE